MLTDSDRVQVDDEDGQMAFCSAMGSDAVHQSLARLREDVPMNFNTVGLPSKTCSLRALSQYAFIYTHQPSSYSQFAYNEWCGCMREACFAF